MVSNEGSSASASSCGVGCAQTRNAGEIENNNINNPRIFIPDLYPQITQISADYFCHPDRSPFDSLRSLRINSAESREPVAEALGNVAGFLDFARNDSTLVASGIREKRAAFWR